MRFAVGKGGRNQMSWGEGEEQLDISAMQVEVWSKNCVVGRRSPQILLKLWFGLLLCYLRWILLWQRSRRSVWRVNSHLGGIKTATVKGMQTYCAKLLPLFSLEIVSRKLLISRTRHANQGRTETFFIGNCLQKNINFQDQTCKSRSNGDWISALNQLFMSFSKLQYLNCCFL